MNSVDRKKLIGRLSIYHSMLILLVICVFATILSPSFLNVASLFNVSKQITAADIVGCGMTFIVLTEGIDLSVGSILGLAGVLASGVLESTDNMGVATSAALAVDIGCGTVSGFFMTVCETPPFTSTLGMTILLRGCILIYTKGSPIPTKVDGCKFFSKGTVTGVPVPVTVLITLFLTTHYVLTQASYDRSTYILEDNRKATRLSGISVRFTEQAIYTLNGLMCSVAGVTLTARLGSAQSTSGTGIEMDAIAAVILGGMSLSGGVGFVFPIVVGAMIVGIVGNIPTLMNINLHAINVVKGAVTLIAVLVDKKVKDLSAKAEQRIENRVNIE